MLSDYLRADMYIIAFGTDGNGLVNWKYKDSGYDLDKLYIKKTPKAFFKYLYSIGYPKDIINSYKKWISSHHGQLRHNYFNFVFFLLSEYAFGG